MQKATDQKKEHSGTIIYADLGVASGKRPMAPPLSSFDQVVYSSVHQPATQMWINKHVLDVNSNNHHHN